ncbi:MAG: RagB/SusD family nutrient uptake outer membrane protein [Paramuribaculum sp.]|nr:RagB/SusD family nutrient uptake outer membrane protein [Paramuribaculum sp.]
MNIYKWILAATAIMTTSCSDFLDTYPGDALSPATTWQTEVDAQKFLVGCYSGWVDDSYILYLDCGSDFGYNNFQWEGWKTVGNGLMAPTGDVVDYYNFSTIRRCNDFLTNIENVPFADASEKDNMKGQAMVIRAFRYFLMNQFYGGVPIIDSYQTAEEAQVARNTEEEVKDFIYSELDKAIPMLREMPEKRGYIARGTALALKMRSALYYGDYQRCKEASEAIMAMGRYNLESDFAKLFMVEGQGSDEIIISTTHDSNQMSTWIIATMYNNANGGWSSIVPSKNLVDAFEMKNGLTRDEAGSGYDPVHPFANRDPRLAMTLLYPGKDWEGGIFNTLDRTLNGANNPNHPLTADNASKTGLTWAKYLGTSSDYYGDMWDANVGTIIFRYAEVLLSYAEAVNELTGPSEEVYNAVDRVRLRAGMPPVDRNKYAARDALRQLIRRERSVEFAGEGLRRFDILRWTDESGRMVAETVMNGPFERFVGTVDYNEADPEKRAVISGTELIENRTFSPYQKYLPIMQSHLEKNPNLTQNPGY